MFRSFHHLSVVDTKERRPRRSFHLLIACTAMLYMLLCVGSLSQIHAQSTGEPPPTTGCGNAPHDVCEDDCCQVDELLLNSGYDHGANKVYPVGSLDTYWTIIEDDGDGTRKVPRPANVVNLVDLGSGTPLSKSQWISDAPRGGDLPNTVTYQKCFCICGPDDSEINFALLLLGLNTEETSIFLDGEHIITLSLDPDESTPVEFVQTLAPGRHCIEIRTTNHQGGPSGIDIQGTLQGEGLLKYTCCGAPPIFDDPDDCLTDHLVLPSNPSWTIQAGPSTFGPYPRCADIIPNYSVWAPPVDSGYWIGANPNGTSGPPHVGYDLYTYRKTFCVEEAGTFIITIESAADDSGAIYLNGVFLGNTGPYDVGTTQTFIVGLDEGCHCIDFNVFDLGFSITGLTALIDIQGGILRDERCCDCGGCSAAPPGNQEEHQGLSDVPYDAAGDLPARATLLSIPNPATGEAMIHYVLDSEAEARVALYNAAGERVLVVDEGLRGRGEHTVPVLTRKLPAGAYRLQLTYGEKNLSIPLNVQ